MTQTSKQVVVVGGGVIGAAIAQTLQRRGFQVILVDAGEPGGQCSAGNAGLLVPSHIVPLAAPGVIGMGMRWLLKRDAPFALKPRLSTTFLRWLLAFRAHCNDSHVARARPVLHQLIQESMDLFGDLEAELGFEIHRQGLLLLHHSEKGRQGNLALLEQARALGQAVRELDREQLLELEPKAHPNATGAVYFEQDAHLDPSRLVDALLTDFRKHGGRISAHNPVTGFAVRDQKIAVVQTEKEDLEADEVVLAGGAWSPRLGASLGVRLPIEAGKGYSVTHTPSPGPRPRVPMIHSEEKLTVTPLGAQIRFSGTLQLSGLDASVDTPRAQPMLNLGSVYLPWEKPTARVNDQVWSGFRPCTPDGLPLVGRIGPRNLTVASGHAMIGITLAPVTGRIVADILAGQAGPSALDPSRFA